MSTHSPVPFPDEPAPAWWDTLAEQRGGDGYAALVAAQRRLQDTLSAAVLPADLLAEVTSRLTDLCDLLADHRATERERWDGWRPDLPGRAMALLPPYVIDERGEGTVHGRVTFTRFYLGGGGAVHGGSHTLLFDDLMGQLAGLTGGICRTAYLTTNYRRITPIDVELTFDCRLDSIDGRKRYLSSRLYNASGEVVADCAGLFLKLLPGQQ